MGVLNVTPDSFSDGGLFMDVDRAVDHAREMEDEGAAIVDVGGESTRPGAEPVPEADELERVIPVVERIATDTGPRVSIDTRKARVAEAALQAGARIVNDVSAFRTSPEIAEIVASAGAGCILMHMRGDDPRTMQDDPRYDDVVSDVKRFLEARLAAAVDAGICEELICLDPGIGFGKTVEHNFELVRRLEELVAIGRPILIGFSRKSSLAKILGRDSRVGTAAASLGAAVASFDHGATIIRAHEVRDHVEALAAARAVRG